MVDWLLGKLGLMRVSDHDNAYNNVMKEWADDCDEYERQIDSIRAVYSRCETWADQKHAEDIARIQREADYWRDECLKARGTK